MGLQAEIADLIPLFLMVEEIKIKVESISKYYVKTYFHVESRLLAARLDSILNIQSTMGVFIEFENSKF